MNVTKWNGEKIAAPGCYSGVPMEAYHQDLCIGPSISSSGLRLIEAKTPLHFYAQSYLNPNRLPEEQKDHFSFGKAAHTLLLGESGFREQYAVRPETWSDWRTKAAQEWKAEQIAAGRTVLTNSDIVAIKGIASSLASHPLVKSGILQGLIEHTIVAKDEKTGVWFKARPDVIPVSDGVVCDLKSTTDASPDAVRRSILNFNYPAQGALVGNAMKAAMGITMSSFVLIFFEKDAPHAVSVVEVDPQWLFWANRQLRRALDTFANCIQSGIWPGYENESTASMPDWLQKRFEREANDGLLPEEVAA